MLNDDVVTRPYFVNGKLQYKLVTINGGPRYDIEPTVKSDSVFLINRTKNNKLVGLLKNCELEKSTDHLEKLQYLNKLNLIPNESAGSLSNQEDTDAI